MYKSVAAEIGLDLTRFVMFVGITGVAEIKETELMALAPLDRLPNQQIAV